MAISTLEDILLGEFFNLEVVTLGNHLCYLGIPFGHLVGNSDLELHILVVDDIVFHGLDMLGVIWIVVYCRHRAKLVKAPGKHSLGVEISKAERSDNLRHTLGLAIVLNSLEQGCRHFSVIDKVYPSKAHALAIPTLVGLMVDDGGNASDYLARLVGKVIFSLAEVEGRITVVAKSVVIVAIKSRHIILIAFVQVIMELYEGLQVFLGLDLPDFY